MTAVQDNYDVKPHSILVKMPDNRQTTSV